MNLFQPKTWLVGGSFTIQSQLCIRTPHSQNFNNACHPVQDVPTLVDSLWIWYHIQYVSCSVIAYFYLTVFCPIIPSSIQVLLITLSCHLSLSGIVSFGLRILPLTICVQFSAKQMEITYVNLCLSREDQIQI